MPTEQEIEVAMDESAENPDGRTSVSERTGEHDGQAATVTVERWLEVGTDDEGGVLATPMIRIEVVYDGFEGVTSFPFEGPASEATAIGEWAIGDMVDGGYHETLMLDRLGLTEVTLTPKKFVPAIRAVMAEASDIVRAEFGL